MPLQKSFSKDPNRSDNAIRFTIIDRGKGIDPEKQRLMATAKAGVGLRGREERAASSTEHRKSIPQPRH